MASLAVLLKRREYHITGSDRNVYPPMSTFLQENNIPIMEGYDESHLTPRPDLVVIGNALSRGNPEVEVVLEQGIAYVSMAELLREFFIQGKTSLVVTGTHGKTTTTSLMAWVFECADKHPGFMIGGIPENFGTSCKAGEGQYFITEGDEYDTAFFDKRSKFFHYHPHQLLINNLEFDHADIFNSLEDILRSFRLLLRLVPRNGLIVANGDDANVQSVLTQAYSPVITFGMGDGCQVQISQIRNTPQGTAFQMDWKGRKSYEFQIPLLGEHNVRNAVGVTIFALHNGIEAAAIQNAFDQFQNIKRRQELRGTIHEISVYDDFAHHPTAIRETIRALKNKHPQQRLIAVFEPRSNTSVQNVHQAELIEALQEADKVVLARPHRADSIPDEKRLDTQKVVDVLASRGMEATTHDNVTEILDHLVPQAKPNDVILIMSNGKFENIHVRLLDALKETRS